MLRRFTARVAVYLLGNTTLEQKERDALFSAVIDKFKDKSLNNKERQMFTTILLDKLGALPLHAKIMVDKAGRVFVNGRSLNTEEADRLKQAAVAMQNNAARNLVREAVTFMAIVDGVHKNITPEMGLFAKAALWFLQEEDTLYTLLAAEGIKNDE